MLIDGQKWACEACIRGHRVTSCKHHDRPLIRIKRKGRPFATCSICNATPCEAPTEHARLKREAELKSPSSKVTQLHTKKASRFHHRKADLRQMRRRDADGMVLMFLLWFLESNPRQTIPASSQLERLPPHRSSTVGQ
ncbi:Putative Copper fist DNA binding domain protein [Penicillium brasilianum]|uniref:Putative Copper fist DNA binding domain protein n=1 Tax=Penicillium brasilianum TaxID=104259 RepID=A0A0F7TNP8_PENBI|nr:Putative Copper fist DNA binding domain protein [Penicillium brasilianum]